MQVLFSIPEFQERYAQKRDEIFRNAPSDPTQDFHVQMAKLGHGLLSGEYSKPPSDAETTSTAREKEDIFKKVVQPGIRPRMFKSLIGKGHREFSTMHQQDALEFLQYVLEIVERREKSHGLLDPSLFLRFNMEERVECSASHKVQYKERYDNTLGVRIPLEHMTNRAELSKYEEKLKAAEAKGEKLSDEETVRPIVPLLECIKTVSEPEAIESFYSTAVKRRTTAIKTTKFATFPEYLVIAMKKFVISEGWVPKKMDVFIDVPDELDLEFLRAKGKQPGEEELPEDDGGSEATQGPTISAEIVAQLKEFMPGQPDLTYQKAALNTGNAGVEPAMNWLLEHMADPDIGTPIPGMGGAKAEKSADVSEASISALMDMGISRDHSIKALKATDGNVERAVDWVFSHQDELASAMETDEPTANKADSRVKDGPGSTYSLGLNSTF